MKKLIYLLFVAGITTANAQQSTMETRKPKLLAARLGTGLLGYKSFDRSNYLNVTNYYYQAQATFNSKHLLKPGFDVRYRHSFELLSFGDYQPDASTAGYFTMGIYESRRFVEFYTNCGLGVHAGTLADIKSFSVAPEFMNESGISFKPLKQVGIGFHYRLTANPRFYTASLGTHVSYCIPYRISNK
jgi:hypothetical protein